MSFASPLHGAIWAFDHGFKVFPLIANDKKPAIKDWQKYANTATRATIETSGHTGNWGIYLGSTNHFALDLDKKNGLDGEARLRELEAIHGKLPKTLTVRTAGQGLHLIFKGSAKATQSKLADGMDTRGIGSYIVGAGSVINERIYMVEIDCAPAEAPEWLMKLIQAVTPEREIAAPVDVTLDTDEKIKEAIAYLLRAPICVEGSKQEGEYGGEYLLQIFYGVRDLGISKEKARELVLEHYNPRCVPPWESEEHMLHFDSKAKNAYNYPQNPLGAKSDEARAKSAFDDFADVPFSEETVKALAAEKKAIDDGFYTRIASDIVGEEIPVRKWVVSRRLLRGFLSVLASPGGVGKSNWEILAAMSIVTGRDLLGPNFKVIEKGPCLLVNGEDPLEEMERRVEAFRIHFRIHRSELRDLHLISGQDQGMTFAHIDHTRTAIPHKKDLAKIISTAKRVKAVMVSFDPMISFHGINENDNVEMSIVVDALKQIAKEVNCAVSLVHHTNKSATRANDDGSDNVAHLRGATALANGARVVHLATTMSEKEANGTGIAVEQRRRFFKMESAKANLSLPPEFCDWYKSVGVIIGNGEEIGVCEVAELKGLKAAADALKKEKEEAEERAAIIAFLYAHIAVGERKTLTDIQKEAHGQPWWEINTGRFRDRLKKALDGVAEFTIERGKNNQKFVRRKPMASTNESLMS